MTSHTTPHVTPDLRTRAEQLVADMRTIQLVAGQCSVEGDPGTPALMAAAEAERCRTWADRLESFITEFAAAERLQRAADSTLSELQKELRQTLDKQAAAEQREQALREQLDDCVCGHPHSKHDFAYREGMCSGGEATCPCDRYHPKPLAEAERRAFEAGYDAGWRNKTHGQFTIDAAYRAYQQSRQG